MALALYFQVLKYELSNEYNRAKNLYFNDT